MNKNHLFSFENIEEKIDLRMHVNTAKHLDCVILKTFELSR